MKAFAQLFSQLEGSTKTNQKVAHLLNYFRIVNNEEKVWAIALFCGKRPKRPISTRKLRELAAEMAQIPSWLFEESYHITGDLAETLSLLLPSPIQEVEKSLANHLHFLIELASKEPPIQEQHIKTHWAYLPQNERLVFNKLITGGFRVGVSQGLLVKALAQLTNQEASQISLALAGDWKPRQLTFEQLLLTEKKNKAQLYPFCLAHPLQESPETLGNIKDWLLERKWDGIRGQLILREGEAFIWSRGEELNNDSFPELLNALFDLPNDAVIDGEILSLKKGEIQPFQMLQKRLNRKKPSAKIIKDFPVGFMAYDLLELDGKDLRNEPLFSRITALHQLLKDHPTFMLSEILDPETWEQAEQLRQESRAHHAEGLMLKHKESLYNVGRKRGAWWKWKSEPYTIDAVMLYAQRGHGRRANLYSDYTFALWNDGQLLPFAKAYSGLSDREMHETDKWIKQHTLERFGPVCRVEPHLVFELAFEGIQWSTRHKSGVAVRFPRIVRIRTDKSASQANTLDDLKLLIDGNPKH